MSLVGNGSPTSKTLKKRCSGASRRISRSGLLREPNGTRTACRRAGKDRQRNWRAAKRGEGGVGRCSRHRRVTTLGFFIAIFGRREELVTALLGLISPI